MASESGERRAAKQSQASAPPAEPEHLPCPRCDSTNTKFCYYNNYNFSQPRHFCKSCRRYWTHGGTLRDIPVGGGSRKNAKRSRISAPSTAAATVLSHDYRHISTASSPLSASLAADHGGTVPFKAGLNVCGSFTSLLNTQGPAGLLVLGGFGLGIDEMGFGLGRALRPFPSASVGLGHDGIAIGSDGANVLQGTWQLESVEGGFVGVGDF